MTLNEEHSYEIIIIKKGTNTMENFQERGIKKIKTYHLMCPRELLTGQYLCRKHPKPAKQLHICCSEQKFQKQF